MESKEVVIDIWGTIAMFFNKIVELTSYGFDWIGNQLNSDLGSALALGLGVCFIAGIVEALREKYV